MIRLLMATHAQASNRIYGKKKLYPWKFTTVIREDKRVGKRRVAALASLFYRLLWESAKLFLGAGLRTVDGWLWLFPPCLPQPPPTKQDKLLHNHSCFSANRKPWDGLHGQTNGVSGRDQRQSTDPLSSRGSSSFGASKIPARYATKSESCPT